MTLLITIIAAVISTVVWYSSEKARELKTGVLLYMFWGASLMWLVDAVAEYIEAGADYFTPAAQDMLNDAFLGLSVIALALVVWLVRLLITDPKGVVRDRKVHEEVIRDVLGFADANGFEVLGLDYSPVKGPEGNIEYLMHIRKTVLDENDSEQSKSEVIDEGAIDKLVTESHDALDK